MLESKKTILIPINQGIAFRYFFQTDIYKYLNNGNRKLVLLVPDPEDDYVKELKRNNSIFIRKYNEEDCKKYHNSNKINIFLNLIRAYTQNSKYNIVTTQEIYNAFLEDQIAGRSKMKMGKRMHAFLSVQSIKITVYFTRRSRLLRRLLLLFQCKFFSPDFHSKVFDEFSPDLLLVSSLGTFNYDQYLMREAKKRKVSVISVVLSWDNTTCRGMPAAVSDKVIAWTDIMKKELIELNDIDSNKIFVGGVAHYDHYFVDDAFMSKDKLFSELGLINDRRTIFFGTKSPNCYANNALVAKLIVEAIKNGHLYENCQLLVRMHPIYYRRIDGELVFQSFLDEMLELKKLYNHFVINEPVMKSNNLNYAMPEDEIKLLASILKYSDLMVNIFSTLNIEASVFDTPIVNVSFNGHVPEEISKARYNVDIDLNQSHNQRIVQSDGVAMAYKEDQLIPLINEELSNPLRRRKGRQRIVQNEAGPLHGNAGKKIADLILSG